ncbi:DUF4111 domain-containing protein [Virgibacillus sp. 179-BFC.A HS]|uniref:Spectinomycin 9-adenylyltransferase n=1 Tax=Tigheibacillus jepli TaxID=3035914 RepID=A0ABU5CGZ9_9BACI|nr:aminoglycoside adenylyltransferase domain-containing protein [Virgibacillus sp. 179-BFC.A HS]MDY0405571.1 DUF4111 domain-containing protein [Virgibacillus sp. 179-BFC.A HS]
MELQSFLDEFTAHFSTILKQNLEGIYLHGSAAMGCYQEGKSDIDLLIIVGTPISLEVKQELIAAVLKLEEKDPQKQTEWSILRKADLNHFLFPTPFELHYSKSHKDKYVSDPKYTCADGVDADLAAHIVVTQQRGICLYGTEISSAFPLVAEQYFIRSIVHDVSDAMNEIVNNPVYYTLNLCRVLYYFRRGSILSKSEAGQWALEQPFSSENHSIILHCLQIYESTDVHAWRPVERMCLVRFAENMLREIEKELARKGYNGIQFLEEDK